MNAALRHVANDEVADRDVIDVLVMRAKRALLALTRRPPASVEDRAVLADERIATFRCNGPVDRMYAGLKTEYCRAGIAIDGGLYRRTRLNRNRVRRTCDRWARSRFQICTR